MDNKIGENYFGHFSQQLRSKGGSAFQAISDRLVLKTSLDLAFGNEGVPLLGILLDQQRRPTHLALRSILQNLYKQMMEPIPGLKFSSVERHALPALEDGFGRKYKQEWMESFCKHLEQYDVNKLQCKS